MDPALWWIAIGVALIVAELALSSFVVIFFGVAAVLTGLLIFLGLPTGSGIPYAVFASITVALLLTLRRHCRGWFSGRSIAAGAGNRDDDFIGREAQVSSGFADGDSLGGQFRGKVEFRGTQWRAVSSEAFAAGERVLIHSREGATLSVERPTRADA